MRIMVLLLFIFSLFILSTYKFIGSCKNGIQKGPLYLSPTIPQWLHKYIAQYQNQEIDIKCIHSSVPFYHFHRFM